MNEIIQISSQFIDSNIDYSSLIDALREGFSNKNIIVPLRHHHDFPNPTVNHDSTLLLMPAWNPGKTAGVKIVSVSPDNAQFKLPSIQGSYLYLDATTGVLKAILDGKSMTAKRTAAASALASSYLSKIDSSSLLMIGTGTLSIPLIRAHMAVRPIEQVYIWGRNKEKALHVKGQLKDLSIQVETVDRIEDAIRSVDIVSCATLSKEPLVFGRFLQNGQHVDLVGAYKKDMREADDTAIQRSSIYVDTYEGGLKESGDIVIPLNRGIISKESIQADLFDLCAGLKEGRKSADEITLFKSVGHALEDLIAADYFYNKFINE